MPSQATTLHTHGEEGEGDGDEYKDKYGHTSYACRIHTHIMHEM